VQASEASRAMAAAMPAASSLDLAASAAVVLRDSNKLTLRLLPCDVLARVAPVTDQVAQLEIELAQRLAGSGSPVAALAPRVDPRGYEREATRSRCGPITCPRHLVPRSRRPVTPVRSSGCMPACARSISLRRTSPTGSSRLSSSWRAATALRRSPRRTGSFSARRCEACGERNGLLFIDLETCCRGPVEFDFAHVPAEAGGHYPGVNQDLLRECRLLVLAMITTWRWDRGDQFPDGRRLAAEGLSQIRTALDRMGLDTSR
jgi:hypothetical protein